MVESLGITVAEGDFHIEAPRAALLQRRQAFAPGVWTQLDEVHGNDVHTVGVPGEHDFAIGDGLVTRARGAVLAVWVGDCAPVVLVGDDGTLGAAHVGWKGALNGVLAATYAAMQPSDTVRAYLGPCIHPCCYEFGPELLADFRQRFGESVVGTTAWGTQALDMRVAVRAALAELDVVLVDTPTPLSECTACHADRYFSHRRRAQHGRQVMTVSKRAAA